MARIAPETIDRVRDAASIVDVISQYLDLRKRGQNFIGLCPFHNDSRPSLYVSPIKQIYKCFACGAGGNAFTFLMEYDKVTFVEAVKRLGDKYGIEVKLSGSIEQKDLYNKLYGMHAIATKYYHNNLFSSAGKKALDYLLKRDLSEDIIKQFKVGFALDGWENLLKKMQSEKYSTEEIDKSGLFTKSDKGVFDRFHNRIIFPIFNTSDKVVAFGGRAMNDDEPAKYLNSPETPLYHKSDILYGLHASRQPIRKKKAALLVEGYMDFLMLYQAGIKNVVAVSGTSMTERHTQQIRKFTNRVYLAYDGDQAGTNAAIRAGYLLYKGSIEPFVMPVPHGMDPDDWVRQDGAEAIKEAAQKAMPLMEFQIKATDIDSLTAAERSRFVDDMMFQVAGIGDNIIRDELLKTLGQKMQIDEQELYRRIKIEITRQRRGGEHSPAVEQPTMDFTSLTQKAQLILVRILADESPQVRQFARDKIDLALFTEPLLKQLAEILMPLYNEIRFASIIDQFNDKHDRELVSKIIMEEELQEDPKKAVTDCIYALKSFPLKEKIKVARIKIRDIEAKGEDADEPIIELAQLRQELRELK